MANQILRNAPFFYPTKSFNFFLNLTVFQVRKEGEGGVGAHAPFYKYVKFYSNLTKIRAGEGASPPPFLRQVRARVRVGKGPLPPSCVSVKFS
jgi:hypothetical protein